VLEALTAPAGSRPVVGPGPLTAVGDATDQGAIGDDDLQLALYTCFELRYRGFEGVDPDWEDQPELVRARRHLTAPFLADVRARVGPAGSCTPADVEAGLLALTDGDGPSLSGRIEQHGTLEQLRELAVHRSAYQLKEADPHSYAIPRMGAGRAKDALVEIQADEYGDGRRGAAHQDLFAVTMERLGLSADYGAHVDLLPATTLATVNLLSLFGTSRRWLGACIGHLALFEMTSVGPMGRYGRAVRRLTGDDDAARFYDVHVEADAHHQVLALESMVRPLLHEEPDLSADVLFGARALAVVEGAFTEHVTRCWDAGRTSLRAPLPTELRVAS
jgi:hypothetical protein